VGAFADRLQLAEIGVAFDLARAEARHIGRQCTGKGLELRSPDRTSRDMRCGLGHVRQRPPKRLGAEALTETEVRALKEHA
jgi:hypothetical protein